MNLHDRTVIQADVVVRARNQITLPKQIVQAMKLEPGDRLLFVAEKGVEDRAVIHRLPRSYAGIAPDAYGDSSEYVRGEREDWT
jgi:bifunctional DNA-binding transcriptional regulator/antitoxin component of YhaV-PrlF toxin-antitoxin module